MEIINKKTITNKIFNELKFNKKLVHNWIDWFNEESKLDLRKFIESEIEKVLESLEQEKYTIDGDQIEDRLLFKKINKEKKSDQNEEPTLISFSSEKYINPDDIKYNHFIKNSFKDFILGAIWVETVGKLIDGTFSSDIYANRLSNNNSSFFKPYYSAYSDFRDSSFGEMTKWIENEETGVFVQTDLTRCFYHINLEKLKESVTSFFKSPSVHLLESITEYKYINDCVFKIIDKYNELFETQKLEEELPIQGILPIGFLPSNILANLYLIDLDEAIKEKYHPIKYGRYVDDISFLVKKDVSAKTEDSVTKSITKNLDEISRSTEIKEKHIVLNPSKTIIFLINEKNDINYLKKFEKETQVLSSDSFRLLDPEEFEDEFSNAYNLSKDITKMADMFTIIKDKKHISRMISTIYYYIFNGLKVSQHRDFRRIARKFIDYFYSFVDDEFFLELYDYWNYLMTIELVSFNLLKLEDTDMVNRMKIFSKLNVISERYDGIIFIRTYCSILQRMFCYWW